VKRGAVPLGCGQVMETQPKPHFRGLLEFVGEVFAPPIFIRPSPLGLPINTGFFRDQRNDQVEIDS